MQRCWRWVLVRVFRRPRYYVKYFYGGYDKHDRLGGLVKTVMVDPRELKDE